MSLQVQLGFTDAGVNAPFFVLDDATKGVLNNTLYVLGGGEALVDVTDYVRAVSIQRGKSRELDRYDAGQASVIFNNNNRAFDPTFVASPFWGQIAPKRRIRITMDSVPQFDGEVDDWNIEIDPSGISTASCQAFGPFSKLANLELATYSPSQELSGARINGALTNVGWPLASRDIDTGGATLAAQIVPDGTAVLDYLQQVADSEPGELFASKSGDITFIDRLQPATDSGLLFTDRGTGIAYQDISIVYGSELLYNRITALNEANGYTASDSYSIALYGERDLELQTLLANDSDLEQIANYLLARYKQPELRFESFSVNLATLTAPQRAAILTMELGDIITVELMPGNIPPAIRQLGKVITLNYDFAPDLETVQIGIASIDGSSFILDDVLFGILDTGVLGW